MGLKKTLVFWLGIFLLLPKPAMAVGSPGVVVSPPFAEVKIEKNDQEKSFDLVLQNNTTGSLNFELSVLDFGSLDESGGVAFLTVEKDELERKYSLASWISLEKNRISIDPGKTETVKVTILNKDSLVPGGHYGSVLATVKSNPGERGDLIGLNQSLASLIYVLKTGGEKYRLDFKSLEIKRRPWDLPSSLNLRFENSGNVHITPRGKVEVSKNGKTVALGIINAESGKILPESFRVFGVPVSRISKWVWPGRYQLKVSYRYDGKDDFSEYKTSFVYFGIEGAILIISSLTIVFLVIKILWIKRLKTRENI